MISRGRNYVFITRPLVRGRSSRNRRHNEPDPTVEKAIYTTAAIETVRARRADHPVARVGGRVCIRIILTSSVIPRRTNGIYSCIPGPSSKVVTTLSGGVDPAGRRTKEKVCFRCARVYDMMRYYYVYNREHTLVLTPKCQCVCV